MNKNENPYSEEPLFPSVPSISPFGVVIGKFIMKLKTIIVFYV